MNNSAEEFTDQDGNTGEPRSGLREWLLRTTLQDRVASHNHSRDFNGSRAEYIYLRVRLLSFVFALLAPLWIPIDLVLLSDESFKLMLLLRLSFSALFLVLGVWTAQPHSLPLARLRVALFIAIPGLFYIGSRLVLGGETPDAGILMGYGFPPYLVVSLLALFPFTLSKGWPMPSPSAWWCSAPCWPSAPRSRCVPSAISG